MLGLNDLRWNKVAMRGLVASIVCCVMTLAGAAAIADAARRVQFNIAAQALTTALVQFSDQAGLQFTAPGGLLGEVKSTGVRGEYSTGDALGVLLEGTGFTYRFVDEGTVAITESDVAERRAAASRVYGGETDDSVRIAQPGTTSSDTASSSAQQGAPGYSDAKSSTQVSLAEETLDEIVVTAQKRKERLKDVPISISVLSGEDLDRSTAQGITEALTRVPGVAAIAHSQGGGTLVTMRGVTASGPIFGGSSPIAYYLDSVPFGLVQTAIAPDANAYDLERVEALRGPQGTLYGANAQNGVVRVLTKDANLNDFEFKARGSISATEEGGDNYRGDMALNVPIVAGKLAARGVIGSESLSGWIDQPLKRNANDAELHNARLKINAQPIDKLSIGAFAWFSRQDYGAPSYSNDQRQTAALLDESIAVDYDVYGAKVAYDFSAFTLNSMTSYIKYDMASSQDLINVGYPSVPFFTGFDAHLFSQEINLSSTHAGPWRWTMGAIFRDGTDKNFQEIPEVFPFVAGWTNTSKSYALFGEISRRFYGDKLEWTLGGRYFNDEVMSKEDPVAPPVNPAGYYREQDSFDSVTPRAVLTWYPTRDLTAYGSYSEGFRSGTPQSFSAAGVPAVRPDKLRNYEVGVKADVLDRRVSLDTALFYIDWQDVQQQLSVPFNSINVTAIVNAPSASGIGFDLGLTVRPIDGLALGVNFNWNDLTVDSDVISSGAVLFDKGDRLNFSPERTLGASADYVFPLGANGFEMRLSASGNYTSVQGFRTIIGGEQSRAFGDTMLVARTSLSLQAPADWVITLFADNINNEKDAIYGNPFGGVPLPFVDVRVRPRTVGFQAEYRF